MAQIGFIGMGNMGYAMLRGSLKNFDKADIIFTDVNEQRVKKIYDETGVRFVESNAECANGCKYLVLAVKPQYYSDVLKNIENIVTREHVIISIAPGITIDNLKERLGFDKKIVRAMPNTPALVGEGMSGICFDQKAFTLDELSVIEKIFSGFGKVHAVEERLMDAVVCASGSSPAYVYMFIEALADSAVKYGIPRNLAYQFVAQTVIGSAKMVLKSGKHPAELKDMVCSPAGTTIAAVEALEEYGFRNAIMKATDACYDKCVNMKKKTEEN
ncbi:MAG: pyrroline-5-carboxylate reductase [Clostridiales bacterium]|nr:pyrroline-5-carboxylate reductase [Clostridiales bacterium]